MWQNRNVNNRFVKLRQIFRWSCTNASWNTSLPTSWARLRWFTSTSGTWESKSTRRTSSTTLLIWSVRFWSHFFEKLSIFWKMPISISWSVTQNFRSPEKCQFRSPEMGFLDHSPILTETTSNPLKIIRRKSVYSDNKKPIVFLVILKII